MAEPVEHPSDVLCEFYPAEPVVQYLGPSELLVLGGSYFVSGTRVFIPGPVRVGLSYPGYVIADGPQPVVMRFDNTNGAIDQSSGLKAGTDYGLYLGQDGSFRLYEGNGDTVDGEYGGEPVAYRRIGGFHTLFADVGTLMMKPQAGVFNNRKHPLYGFTAKSVLPKSVWALNFRPSCPDPRAMAYVREFDLWVDLYLSSGSTEALSNQSSGKPLYNVSFTKASTALSNVGKRLLSSDEFYASALGSNCSIVLYSPGGLVVLPACGPEGGWFQSLSVERVDLKGSDRAVSAVGCEAMCGWFDQWISDFGPNVDAPDGYSDTAAFTGGANAFGRFQGGVRAMAAGGSLNMSGLVGPMCRRSVADAGVVLVNGASDIGVRGCCPCLHAPL